MRSQSDCCSYNPPQRLELRKIEGNSGWKERENMRREGSLCLPDATPKTRDIRGSTFSIFNLHLGIITIKLLSLLVLNVSGHSWACLANIAILMQNAESCLGDYQGYHRSKVYCS